MRAAAVGAYAHQEVPFEQLVTELRPVRDWSRNPLFDVMFILQNTPMPAVDPAQSGAQWISVPDSSANFDLTLSLMELDGALCGGIEYPGELFDEARVQRLADHYRTVLTAVAAGVEGPVWRLPMLGAAEQATVVAWETGAAAAAYESVPAAWRRQAAARPDAIAVVEGDAQVSYGALARAVQGLAAALRASGVGRDTRVGVYLDRSIAQVVALLAVWDVGGAWVALDVAWPAARVAWVVADAAVDGVITDAAHEAGLAGTGVRQWRVDAMGEGPAVAAEVPAIGPTQLAYVMYTSGSTGRPKGVLVSHGAVARYGAAAQAQYAVTAADVCLQFASATFDTSVEEIVPCLTAGARLVLRSDDVGDAATFLAACAAAAVTVVNLPTAYWQVLVAGWAAAPRLRLPAAVRLVIIGGEAADAAALAGWTAWVGPGVRLVNTYGPTETTVVATLAELTETRGGPVPIGRPVRGAWVSVRDRWGERVPVGVPGEIWIGGTGVARGYWQAPGLTAARFVPEAGGRRVYRTGDIGRYRADGMLEYGGRRDTQVKVRGQRVELEEVAAALRAVPEVVEAVAALDGAAGQIVGYVVGRPGTPLSAGGVLGAVRARVPAALVPARLVILPALPRLSSGKVDRAALPSEAAPAAPERRGAADAGRGGAGGDLGGRAGRAGGGGDR